MKAFNQAILRASSSARLRSLKALRAATVLAPGLLFGAYALVSYDAIFRTEESKAVHLASVLQEHAQRVFETVHLALASADQRIADHDNETVRKSRSLWDDIRQIQTVGPQLGAIFLIANDGSLLLTTRAFPPPPVTFLDRDYFLAHKEKPQGFYIGRAYVGKISKVPIFNFSIPRSAKGGLFNGVVGVSAYVNYFQEFYSTVGEAGDDYAVLLLRADGEILVRFPAFKVGDTFDPALLRPSESNGSQIQYVRSRIDNRVRLYATTKVGNYPTYIAYSVTRDLVIRRWANSLIVPGGVASAITLILFLLSNYAMGRARSERVAVLHLKEAAATLTAEIERRQELEKALLQSQKLDAVGQLSGGIAHDFNNLLTIISGNLALALKRTEASNLRRFLTAAQYAADRGAGLTRQLLAFSRGQELRPIAVDPKDVLENAKIWMAQAVTEAINLQVHYDDDLWPILVDLAQFEAALLNLVVNARDAMQGHGTLSVEIHNVVFSNNHTLPLSLPAGEYVALSVADNGSGMSHEVLAKVCEPFFTTKAVGKGTGLGLSQVYGFMQQSAGDIFIESEVGRGTTVNLYFPRCSSSPVPVPKPAGPAPTTKKPERVILVVEDDDEVRTLSITLLHELGYRWIAARSGQEALAILSAGGRVDILFTDLILPHGMDGNLLARQALELRPTLEILLTTASLEAVSEFSVVRKPFSAQTLATALDGVGRSTREQHS